MRSIFPHLDMNISRISFANFYGSYCRTNWLRSFAQVATSPIFTGATDKRSNILCKFRKFIHTKPISDINPALLRINFDRF